MLLGLLFSDYVLRRQNILAGGSKWPPSINLKLTDVSHLGALLRTGFIVFPLAIERRKNGERGVRVRKAVTQKISLSFEIVKIVFSKLGDVVKEATFGKCPKGSRVFLEGFPKRW